MDFGEIKTAFAPLLDQLDHRYLNEVDGLENPTSENVARWIWDRLATSLPLSAVTVRARPAPPGAPTGGKWRDPLPRRPDHA